MSGVQAHLTDPATAPLTDVNFYVLQEMHKLNPELTFNLDRHYKVVGSPYVTAKFSERYLFEDIKIIGTKTWMRLKNCLHATTSTNVKRIPLIILLLFLLLIACRRERTEPHPNPDDDMTDVFIPAERIEGRIALSYVTYYGTAIPDPTYLTHICYAFAELYVDNGVYRKFALQGNESRFADIVGLKKNTRI